MQSSERNNLLKISSKQMKFQDIPISHLPKILTLVGRGTFHGLKSVERAGKEPIPSRGRDKKNRREKRRWGLYMDSVVRETAERRDQGARIWSLVGNLVKREETEKRRGAEFLTNWIVHCQRNKAEKWEFGIWTHCSFECKEKCCQNSSGGSLELNAGLTGCWLTMLSLLLMQTLVVRS